ncbi:MAG: TetR/AcrR family transcriptional regulator [Firmicutes bacterium]|nr:TetR/AcrR family transcriptional regulator [Bacillota bacterium]
MNNLQRSAQTKKSIMEAATSLFAREGYDSTGVAEICERAGVSKGAFYYHFESKEAVFLALIDTWLNTLETTLNDVTYQAKSVPDGLLEMAGMMQPIFENNQFFMGLFLELWTHANRNEKVRQATIAPYRRFEETFTRLIKRGIEEGTLENVEPEIAGQLLLSLSSGFFLQASLETEQGNWGKKLQESIEILLNGMKRRN